MRWDSLGEFLALAVSLEDTAIKQNNARLKAMASGHHEANSTYLSENKAPSRKVKELDNRGTHFYLALYWAHALAKSEDSVLKTVFTPIAEKLSESENGKFLLSKNLLNEVLQTNLRLIFYFLLQGLLLYPIPFLNVLNHQMQLGFFLFPYYIIYLRK